MQVWVSPHTWPAPHPPQLSGSVVVSTQAPPHEVNPAAHVKEQLPPEHTAVAWATAVAQG